MISSMWLSIGTKTSLLFSFFPGTDKPRNNTGFDLWEEVNGSSFFTVAAQHRGRFNCSDSSYGYS